MKVLIVTVAGTATRFNKDVSEETLKCIYYQESPEYSLLNQILLKSEDIDKVIIVGGYLFSKLNSFIDMHLSSYKDKIQVVYNELYNEYGSGYSLIKGIEVIDSACDEVIFVEGDLYFDIKSYTNVITSGKDVLTINHNHITSDKAVALYVNANDEIKYLYDTNHNLLFIPEPIKAIYNSAQIWKFTSLKNLKEVISQLSAEQMKGTNLEIIQGYFGKLNLSRIDIISINKWYNCNTKKDYMDVYSDIKNNEDGSK